MIEKKRLSKRKMEVRNNQKPRKKGRWEDLSVKRKVVAKQRRKVEDESWRR